MPFSLRRPQLPGILVLLTIGAVLWLVPVVFSVNSELRELKEQVAGAEEGAERARNLEILLRLAPAIGTEKNTAAAAMGEALLPDEVPSQVLSGMGLNFTSRLVPARLHTDEILTRLEEDELTAILLAARAATDDSGAHIDDMIESYGVVTDRLTEYIEMELAILDLANGSIPRGGELAHAARVAEATAEVQVVAAQGFSLWAPFVVPFGQPTVPNTIALAANLADLEHVAGHLDAAVVDGHQVAEMWTAFRSGGAFVELQAEFDATLIAATMGPLPLESPPPVELDFVEIDFDAVLSSTEYISDIWDLDSETQAGLQGVMEASLNEVSEAAHDAQTDAVSARNRAMVAFSLLVAVLILSGLYFARVIAGPVLRLAGVARSLRDGDLSEHADERGPKELRIAARAMNEANASLRLAERQALALATEQLDDPALRESAPGELGASLQSAVTRLADSLADRERFQQRLAHEASHDNLTSIANRRAVLAHVESALARTQRASTSLALLFLDLDGFKTINDTYGHHVGDSVLQITAHRLQEVIRQGDLAGRLGGDEFLVVAEPISSFDEAIDLSQRIIDRLSEPVTVDDVTVGVAVSVGVAIGRDDLTPDELLRDADLAVYRAKELGRGRIEVCDETLRGQVVERTKLAQAISVALENDDFVVHFQPIVDGRTSKVNSLEALVRWNHPDEGFLLPGPFIEVAERSNLIVEIDRWVLKRVFAQLAEWSDHPILGELPVAVNISARHLSTGRLVDTVSSQLADHGIAPGRLTLEITETALVNDPEIAASDLTRLRELGVRIALDDFGTGYMSLAYLRSLPVDVLKIDRSFVAAMDTATDHSLIELIVATGHSLGISITAEGVETADQAQRLIAMGSDTLQGFLFSRPVDAETLQRSLEDSQGRLGVGDTR